MGKKKKNPLLKSIIALSELPEDKKKSLVKREKRKGNKGAIKRDLLGNWDSE